MKTKRKSGGGIKKPFAALIITGVVFLAVLALYQVGAFTFLEYKTYDFRVTSLAKHSRPSDDIIFIVLSNDSIDWAQENRGWGWPWPRQAYAEIVDYMNMGEAHSIAFDMIYSEPSIYRNSEQDSIIDAAVFSLEEYQALEQSGQSAAQISSAATRQGSGRQGSGTAAGRQGSAGTGRQGAAAQERQRLSFLNIINILQTLSAREDDASFVRAEEDFGKVVQTVVFSSQTGNAEAWPANLDKPFFELHGFDSIVSEYEKFNRNIEGGQIRAQFPIEELREAAGAIGNVTGWPDSDGILRRANLFSIFDGKAVPGLSAASLLVSGHDNNITYNKKKSEIQWGDRTIPVDHQGRSILHFRGDLNRYPHYDAHQIFMNKEAHDSGKTAEQIEAELGSNYLPPDNFKDSYVFFGVYAQGLFDITATPIGSTYPGPGVHITMLDNILSGDFIRQSTLLFNIIFIFIVVVLVSLLTLFSNRIPLVVGGLAVVLAGITIFGIVAYQSANLWAPMAAPIAGVLVAFFTAMVYNYATEGSQRRFIKSAFSQYLSPLVIDQLVANPGLLNLGGEKREISIFFSDIQGFTTVSEKFKDDPPKLTELLNDYLSFMTDTILDSGGTIDKYEGDAIIAFWNAPLNYEDHAARAINASITCQQLLADRQDFFQQKFGVKLITRIGLNTGFAVVGNMGSSKRFDYTMLGDPVNLAARLEGLNKQFGTHLMCTEETLTQAKKTGQPFFGRKLAQVAVVGKKEAAVVWEPMPESVFRGKEAIIGNFDKARDFFYAGKFTDALPIFERITDMDAPSGYYAEQCRYYIERPDEWKGHWESKTK